MNEAANFRILLIHASPEVHAEFQKVLVPSPASRTQFASPDARLVGIATTPSTQSPSLVDSPFVVDHAHDGEEGLRMFCASRAAGLPYMAVFVDSGLSSGWDGLRTVRELRAVDTDATVVICIERSNPSWNESAPLAGDVNRLLILKKPFEPIELKSIAHAAHERWRLLQQVRLKQHELAELVAIRTGELQAERAKDKTRLDQLEEVVAQRTSELRKTALHDRLTGLPNRVHFHERLLAAIAENQVNPASNYAVMFIDFDRFKVINDSLGHEFGDRLLHAISERLSKVINPINEYGHTRALAARLGGDEFCILVENFDGVETVMEIAENLLRCLKRPYDLKGHQVNSTASIGVTFSLFSYRHAEDVLRDADTAMYCAKSAGRDRAVMFDPTMHERAMRRLVLENDLRHAIARDELHLEFQPIVSLESSAYSGAESLLRWIHSKHGPISPLDFIPLAEETGLIVPIGAWVFEQAARQLLQMPELKYLSVNVSRRQLIDADFVASFDDVLKRVPVDPSRLKIEITESTLINEPERSAIAIDKLRERRMQVLLDDFGTGLSSLGSLRRFPLDGIKLDRSFLDEHVSSRRAAAVIHSAITLAKDLNMLLIAEGVETYEQVALLQALGCEAAQGYLFSKPISSTELLEAWRTCIPRFAA